MRFEFVVVLRRPDETVDARAERLRRGHERLVAGLFHEHLRARGVGVVVAVFVVAGRKFEKRAGGEEVRVRRARGDEDRRLGDAVARSELTAERRVFGV